MLRYTLNMMFPALTKVKLKIKSMFEFSTGTNQTYPWNIRGNYFNIILIPI
jgi:uncharacterized surface anchored protein